MRTVVVFSGAGLSAESGIPTFRDSNGLWENHRVEDVASPEGWQADPNLVLNFYAQRYEAVKQAKPNAAHISLAALEQKFRVVHFTQNIDDLLERAGATDIRHLHGSLAQRKCEWHHGCTTLDGDIRYTCDWIDEHKEPVKGGDLCPKCGSRARPHVVWFGEAVHMDHHTLMSLASEVKYNDGVFICVGTSAQVYPASSLISLFGQVPHKYIVDLKPQKVGDFVLLSGPAGETVPMLVDALMSGGDLKPAPEEKKPDTEMADLLGGFYPEDFD